MRVHSKVAGLVFAFYVMREGVRMSMDAYMGGSFRLVGRLLPVMKVL